MSRVFASWSGGKDCCLACYRATASGLDIRYLANTVTGDGERSCSHGVSAAVIRRQAEALGIPIMQQRTAGDNYEAQFITMLKVFKKEGIEGGVFGDIDFNPHREWIERVCAEAGMTPHLPLWGDDQKKLMEEFIDAGFVAVVIAVKAELFGEEVLGQKIDRDFINQIVKLSKTRDITPCGEAGEYHTLVIDGPLFKKRLEITESRKVEREGIRFLDILNIELKSINRSTV
ncbi:MAG: diphthine--ammonia ligase [Dehalococcoidales bacterium]|nr:diphthine--ammonia ligase [Dehalococcoidales bacterium]